MFCRIKFGILISFGLIIFLTVLLLYIDWCAWRIVRLPLAPFYLTRPFLISAILVSIVGYVCVPFFRIIKFIQVVKKEGPVAHLSKKRVPTLGGLIFVPVGIIVARAIGGFSSIELSGAAVATMAFAAIGFLDDILSLTKNQKRGLPAWAKVLLEVTTFSLNTFFFGVFNLTYGFSLNIIYFFWTLLWSNLHFLTTQVAVGTWFSIWLDITSISSPYGMYIFLLLIWSTFFWW